MDDRHRTQVPRRGFLGRWVRPFSMLLAWACAAPVEGESDPNASGLTPGKTDGVTFSPCELDALVTWLNSGVSVAQIAWTGVEPWLAESIAAHRDGSDGRFGTSDDDLFDDVQELDAIPWTDVAVFTHLVGAVSHACAPEFDVDLFAEARDVNRARVTLPSSIDYPNVYPPQDRINGFYLAGEETISTWPEVGAPAAPPSHTTRDSLRCLIASAIRFTEIMRDPPPSVIALRESSTWGTISYRAGYEERKGSFYNRTMVDEGAASEEPHPGAAVVAERAELIWWVSHTYADRSCELPTWDMVERFAADCMTRLDMQDSGVTGCAIDAR